MKFPSLLLAVCAGLTVSAHAQTTPSLNLGGYTLTQQFRLPGQAGMVSEASAITYNWDTGTLFVVGDEGEAIVEVTRTGEVLGSMKLSGFDDTEALTYVGNGQFVLGEERTQSLFRVDYTANTTATRSASLPAYSLGSYSNNEGLEGVSFDPRNGSFIAVKEKNPLAILQANIDFNTGTGSHGALFNPANMVFAQPDWTGSVRPLDLADIQVLSTVPGLSGTGIDDHLLVISQESRRLFEITRTGEVLGFIDLKFLSGTAEGVTIDENGVIYITQEQPSVFVFTPAALVPEPETYGMLLAGLGLAGFMARRRNRVATTA
jgi:hypothetical protein